MKVRTQDYNDVTVVELQGELCSESVELFKNTITGIIGTASCGSPNAKKGAGGHSKKSQNAKPIAPQKTGIVLDMSGVGFIDGRGLEQLLWARDYCNENNCPLRLAGLDENCEKILEVTRLEKEFDRYIELSEAVKSFA